MPAPLNAAITKAPASGPRPMPLLRPTAADVTMAATVPETRPRHRIAVETAAEAIGGPSLPSAAAISHLSGIVRARLAAASGF